MLIRLQLLILWIGWFSPGFGSVSDDDTKYGFSSRDGAFYTEDAVVITGLLAAALLVSNYVNTFPFPAHVGRERRDIQNSTRKARQFMFVRPRQTDEGAFGTECATSIGKRGTCKSYRECYPLIKVADLTSWDGWAMGHYDTCSYISADNMEVFGVCCTEPTDTPPQQEPDVQRLGMMPPIVPLQVPPMHFGFPGSFATSFSRQWAMNNGADTRQIPPGWPPTIPPLPTHPPDHTAPTHPPSLIAGVTTKPPASNGKPTTWATRPPSTTRPTTKQTWQTIKPAQPTKPTQPARPTQPVVSGCGKKNGAQAYGSTYELQDEERIVGGQNADLNEWPWAVALFNGGRQFCGGSLIDNQHVLSAAHCVAHMTSWDVARLTARLGDHNIKSNTETQHVERKIKRVVRHRGFDMRTLYNDVAVLTLDQPVTFSKTIRPICLPSGSRAYAGMIGTVIGWGSLRESGPQPSILQKVSIPIWTNSECRLKYGAAAPGGIVDHMICAGKASMDSCSGDSGGPLMVNEGGTWFQVGVVSWGIGCGKGQYPGVYTRVTSFLPWIQKNSK